MRTAVSMCIPRAFLTSFMCIHDIYRVHTCNRCAGGSDAAGVQGSQPGGGARGVGNRRSSHRGGVARVPDHRPSSFLKGKPRSILSLPCFYKYIEYLLFVDDALSIGIGWNQLLHYIFILVQISYLNPI